MIFGIGIDTVTVARVEKSMQREGFLCRCFSPEEQAQLTGRKSESAAACFAAKEAFGKALGTGVSGFSLHEVALLRDADGRPRLAFSGEAALIVWEKRLVPHVSVTHEGGFATCMVILEQV